MHRPMHFWGVLYVWCYSTEDRSVCEEYNATTTSELSDVEEGNVGRRQKKKKIFADYYVAGKK